MCDDRYQYVLELSKRASGVLLGRAPICVDWTPVRESLTFDLLRKGILADFGQAPTIWIEPVWRDQSADSLIRGVRATASLGPDSFKSLFVPIEYFRAQARRAADQFVETGDLQPGD